MPINPGFNGGGGGGGGGGVTITYLWNAVTVLDSDANLRTANGQKLPSSLKGAASPWLASGYPISSNWNGQAGSGNGGGGPDATLLGIQCNRYECSNAQKWVDQENAVQAPNPNLVDWSLADAITNVINTNPGTSGQGFVNNFHLVVGQNIYNPAYVTTQLGATPTNILTLVQWRCVQLFDHYTDPASFDRIDVVNEILAGTSVSVATSGWRTAANAFYTASQDATTLSTILGGLAEFWIWTLFIQMRSGYPSARLAWTDFTVVNWLSPTDSFQGPPSLTVPQQNYYLYAGNNQPVFADDNSSYIGRFAYERLVYEVWRMKLAQVPIDVVGLQTHLDYFPPLDELALAWSCWEFNGLGIAPAVTEMSMSWFKTSGIPPQINVGTSINPSYNAAIYGAWYARRFLDVLLRESACSEISGWTNDGNTQAPFMGATTYPLLGQMTLAANAAVPPADRLLKRSRRTEFRQTQLPLWVSFTGGDATAITFPSRRMALSGGRSIQIPFAWYGSARLGRPIGSTAMTMVMSFFAAAALANGNILFGHGVLPSTTFTNEAFGTGDGGTTHFVHTASNLPVKPGSVTITAGGVTGTDDGNGTLNAIGSVRGAGVLIGSVNYATGLMTINFSAAPANAAPITTTYKQAAATAPTDSAIISVGANQAVLVTVLVGNVSKLSLTIGTLQPNEINTVAVRFDGVNICGSVNGGTVTPGIATAALTVPDTVFIASLPDSTGTNVSLQTATFDVHSNLDYQEPWMVALLATRERGRSPTGPRVLSLPFFAG